MPGRLQLFDKFPKQALYSLGIHLRTPIIVCFMVVSHSICGLHCTQYRPHTIDATIGATVRPIVWIPCAKAAPPSSMW